MRRFAPSWEKMCSYPLINYNQSAKNQVQCFKGMLSLVQNLNTNFLVWNTFSDENDQTSHSFVVNFRKKWMCTSMKCITWYNSVLKQKCFCGCFENWLQRGKMSFVCLPSQLVVWNVQKCCQGWFDSVWLFWLLHKAGVSPIAILYYYYYLFLSNFFYKMKSLSKP